MTMMAMTPAPGQRLKRQMALLMPAVADAGRALRPRCRVHGCGHAAGANGLICSAHYFAMPAADARFLARLEAAKRRARDPETSTYLAEQIDGYASQFARKGTGQSGGLR
jgi:hypothetical protein